jgi:hypothetical protein
MCNQRVGVIKIGVSIASEMKKDYGQVNFTTSTEVDGKRYVGSGHEMLDALRALVLSLPKGIQGYVPTPEEEAEQKARYEESARKWKEESAAREARAKRAEELLRRVEAGEELDRSLYEAEVRVQDAGYSVSAG